MLILEVRDSGGAQALMPRGGGAPWGVLRTDNILEPDWQGFNPADRNQRLVAWSGTPSADLFEQDPRSFGPAAWERLGRVCDSIAHRRERVILRPHARHVLSDVQRIVKFMADRDREHFGLALDPASLLEPSMLPKAADHYRRAFETLGPLADLIWLTGAAADEEGTVRPLPLGKGAISTEFVITLWREHGNSNAPIVLLGEPTAAQAAMLERG